MYQTPQDYPEELSFAEAEKAIVSANEALKEHYNSEDFLLQWEDGEITFEFEENGF